MQSVKFTEVLTCFRMRSPQSTIIWPAPDQSDRCIFSRQIYRPRADVDTNHRLLIDSSRRRHESIFLKGNHEAFFRGFAGCSPA
jgi:hypothetical protein